MKFTSILFVFACLLLGCSSPQKTHEQIESKLVQSLFSYALTVCPDIQFDLEKSAEARRLLIAELTNTYLNMEDRFSWQIMKHDAQVFYNREPPDNANIDIDATAENMAKSTFYYIPNPAHNPIHNCPSKIWIVFVIHPKSDNESAMLHHAHNFE